MHGRSSLISLSCINKKIPTLTEGKRFMTYLKYGVVLLNRE